MPSYTFTRKADGTVFGPFPGSWRKDSVERDCEQRWGKGTVKLVGPTAAAPHGQTRIVYDVDDLHSK
jgi:hypothetical protein